MYIHDMTEEAYKNGYARGRAEAITEYHEEVKKRCIEGGIYPAFVNRQMEDVRKEMVGE